MQIIIFVFNKNIEKNLKYKFIYKLLIKRGKLKLVNEN